LKFFFLKKLIKKKIKKKKKKKKKKRRPNPGRINHSYFLLIAYNNYNNIAHVHKMSTIDSSKKRYSCSGCKAEFIKKSTIDAHLSKKDRCCKDPDIHCIETLYTNCLFCLIQVKTTTAVNFMEQHLQTCEVKNMRFHHQDESGLNMSLRSYQYPNIEYLVESPGNIYKNRLELFVKLYFNNLHPENHCIIYNSINNSIRFYYNNREFEEIPIERFRGKVSHTLDNIQDRLIERIFIDPRIIKLELDKIQIGYSGEERTILDTCLEITRNNAKIPLQTRLLIDKQYEQTI
jgi:hypothetical protein